MNVLLIHDACAEPDDHALREAVQSCRSAGHEPMLCRVDLADAGKFRGQTRSTGQETRWTEVAANGMTLSVNCEPVAALEAQHGLVLVFGSTIPDRPGVALGHFMRSELLSRILDGTPFAVWVTGTGPWEATAAAIRERGEASRGHFLGAQGFCYPDGPPDSQLPVATFVRHLCTMVDSERRRVAPLEGGHNFRDIGGYPASDGAHVRWGRVYRSGTMAMLTGADQQYLASLGIKVICDFRSTKERLARPTRWLESHAVVHWSRDHDSSVGELVAAISHPQASAAAMRERMVAAYRHLPYEQTESFQEVFRRIADGDLPLVFHCSAGKDRTGIAAALLLTLLGVPRAQVMRDYLLTERFFERGCRLVVSDPTSSRFAAVDPVIWEPMMRAEAGYLDAMYETLIRRHGSVEGYLEQHLGVDALMRKRIRNEMLE